MKKPIKIVFEHRPNTQTPAEREHEKSVRAQYQASRPTLAEVKALRTFVIQESGDPYTYGWVVHEEDQEGCRWFRGDLAPYWSAKEARASLEFLYPGCSVRRE